MHFPHSQRSSYFTAFRQGELKLVYHYPVNAKDKAGKGFPNVELFNLREDPTEGSNLADSHKELMQGMFSAMSRALEEANAQYPVHDGQELKPSLLQAAEISANSNFALLLLT